MNQLTSLLPQIREKSAVIGGNSWRSHVYGDFLTIPNGRCGEGRGSGMLDFFLQEINHWQCLATSFFPLPLEINTHRRPSWACAFMMKSGKIAVGRMRQQLSQVYSWLKAIIMRLIKEVIQPNTFIAYPQNMPQMSDGCTHLLNSWKLCQYFGSILGKQMPPRVPIQGISVGPVDHLVYVYGGVLTLCWQMRSGERRIVMLNFNMWNPLFSWEISHHLSCLAAAYSLLPIENTCMFSRIEHACVRGKSGEIAVDQTSIPLPAIQGVWPSLDRTILSLTWLAGVGWDVKSWVLQLNKNQILKMSQCYD